MDHYAQTKAENAEKTGEEAQRIRSVLEAVESAAQVWIKG